MSADKHERHGGASADSKDSTEETPPAPKVKGSARPKAKEKTATGAKVAEGTPPAAPEGQPPAPPAEPPAGGGAEPPAGGDGGDGGKQGNAVVRTLFTGLRAVLPVLDEYGRTKRPGEPIEVGGAENLSDDEMRVITEVATKFVYEGASVLRTQSPLGKIEPATRDPKTGRYPPLTAADGVVAVQMLHGWLKKDQPASQQSASTAGGSEVPPPAVPPAGAAPPPAVPPPAAPPAAPRPAIPVQPAPTYNPPRADVSIRSPRQIRSLAMKQKNAYAIESLARPGLPPGRTGLLTSGISQTGSRTQAPQANGGCGCGSRVATATTQGYGRCPSCGGSTQPEPLSVRNEEGNCSPAFFEISCDTQIRLKQCIKTVLCDLLWCLEGEICKNGQPDIQNLQKNASKIARQCLGTALCSLFRCVPEVLCPPQTQCEPPRPCIDVECSYAVEELP